MVPVLRILSHAPMFWALPVPWTLPEVLAVLFLGRTFSAGGQPSEGTLSTKFGGYSMVNPGTHKSSRFFWEVNQFGPRKHILKAEIFVHCSNCSNPMMRREEERLPVWRLGRSWQILTAWYESVFGSDVSHIGFNCGSHLTAIWFLWLGGDLFINKLTGKESYEFGDLSKFIGGKVQEAVGNFTGELKFGPAWDLGLTVVGDGGWWWTKGCDYSTCTMYN
jgi:hypothetical protein